jgi:hypothetical protein
MVIPGRIATVMGLVMGMTSSGLFPERFDDGVL